MKKLFLLFVLVVVQSVLANVKAQTKTYYHYSHTYNGTTYPSDNAPLTVTFYSDGSFSAFGGTWKYAGKGGFFGEEQWKCGNDYATMDSDKSSITFNKQELFGGLFWTVVGFDKYTVKKYTQEDRQAFANLMNGAGGSSVSGGSSANSNRNNGKPYCRRCNGTGEIIKNTYPPQYSGSKDYDKKCYKCNQWFKASLGHCHVTCGSCGGTGRLR